MSKLDELVKALREAQDCSGRTAHEMAFAELADALEVGRLVWCEEPDAGDTNGGDAHDGLCPDDAAVSPDATTPSPEPVAGEGVKCRLCRGTGFLRLAPEVFPDAVSAWVPCHVCNRQTAPAEPDAPDAECPHRTRDAFEALDCNDALVEHERWVCGLTRDGRGWHECREWPIEHRMRCPIRALAARADEAEADRWALWAELGYHGQSAFDNDTALSVLGDLQERANKAEAERDELAERIGSWRGEFEAARRAVGENVHLKRELETKTGQHRDMIAQWQKTRVRADKAEAERDELRERLANSVELPEADGLLCGIAGNRELYAVWVGKHCVDGIRQLCNQEDNPEIRWLKKLADAIAAGPPESEVETDGEVSDA